MTFVYKLLIHESFCFLFRLLSGSMDDDVNVWLDMNAQALCFVQLNILEFLMLCLGENFGS